MATNTPIRKRHQILLSREATPKQLSFYEKFPKFRGVSDQTLDSELLEAVLISALTFGTVQDHVYFFAPRGHEDWVVEQFNKVADVIFEECKKWPDPTKIAKQCGLLFNKIKLVGKPPQVPEEPSHWVSFGFTTELFIPEWMGTRLITGPF